MEGRMYIEVYGKLNCKLCKSAQKKLAHFLNKWQVAEQVDIRFQDMETIDGAAEGAFYDVLEIPATLVKDGDAVLWRWDHMQPDSRELFEVLRPLMSEETIVEAAG
jgi:hypothetical protein